jgi:hypothetical protein
MGDDIDIGAIDRRARAAGYGDGLLELFAAAVLGSLALGWIANPAFVGILAALVAIYGWRVVERVKQRVTYPRIGYHKERPDDARSTSRGMLSFIAGAFALMAVVVLVFGDVTDAADWRRAAPLVSGLTLAAGFWYAGAKSGLLRHRLIAAWSVGSGVLLWWFGTGASYATVAIHLGALALPLAVIGTIGLVRFIRDHPIRDDHD